MKMVEFLRRGKLPSLLVCGILLLRIAAFALNISVKSTTTGSQVFVGERFD